jgi:type II secretory pathway component PulK
MKTTLERLKRKDRAVILVLVLWILVLLSLMAYSLLFQVSTETTITSTRKKQLKALALARAGVGRAIIDLRNDLLFDNDPEAKIFDGEGDVWARPEEGKIEFAPSGEEEDGYFNCHVYDEEGLFNLNKFSATNMIILQKICENIGYDEEDAKIVAAAIVDWRDGDSKPLFAEPLSDDEGKAYAVLKGEDEGGETDPDDVDPLVFRNEDYMTVDELLEVYGVTPDLFFGPGSPEAEHYNMILGGPQGDLFEMEERRRSRLDDEAPVGLRDYFTVYGNGNLNFNTAPAHVLAAFAQASGRDDGERFAERVIKNRRGGREDDIDNSDAFKSVTELTADTEVQNVLASGIQLHSFGVESSAFRIFSEGIVGDTRVKLEVLVYREFKTMVRKESFEYMDRARERRDQNSGRYERRENSEDEDRVNYPFVTILQSYVR